MRAFFALALIGSVCAAAIDLTPISAEPRCRMEKQCRWVNFKKVCTYVRVCRQQPLGSTAKLAYWAKPRWLEDPQR